jgi:hypothetical protein
MRNAWVFFVFLMMVSGGVFAEEASRDESSASAASGDGPTWLSSGRLSLSGRVLEEYEEYAAGMMVPFGLSEKGAVFFDLRGSFLEDREQEVNAGLVMRRHLEGLGVILGANAYYDARWTESDNRFDQAAGGIELLSRWVDLRANYYYPVSDEVMLDETSDTVGGGGVQTTTKYKSYEEALEGVDAEIGVWLPWVSRLVPIAVYGGYYEFKSDLIDDDQFEGAKARLEARLLPNVTLSGEWFEEKALNQSEYIASIKVQVPLGFWRGARLPKAGGPYNPLVSRLTDEVQRDLRVRVIKTGPVEHSTTTTDTPSSGGGSSSGPDSNNGNCHDEFVVDPITGTISVETVCD